MPLHDKDFSTIWEFDQNSVFNTLISQCTKTSEESNDSNDSNISLNKLRDLLNNSFLPGAYYTIDTIIDTIISNISSIEVIPESREHSLKERWDLDRFKKLHSWWATSFKEE